ncbi:VF530 family protein [Planctobacterium marinum]|uniref:VF530 family protein n=1 Tax=Planctobacterium marinum TaxID=1631968 RepID=UPI001E3AE2A5|nr:VF530 family protein [Planctobacterium marinum]MCC2604435.1 VF530 family protein [Planctobacterium marinum]
MNSTDPLHGVTLKIMLTELQQALGWEGLSARVNINCFKSNPSVKSSLTFLRRTPWAREKVENLYRKHKGIKPVYTQPKRQPDVSNPWATATPKKSR